MIILVLIVTTAYPHPVANAPSDANDFQNQQMNLNCLSILGFVRSVMEDIKARQGSSKNFGYQGQTTSNYSCVHFSILD